MATSTPNIFLGKKLPDFKRAFDYTGNYPAKFWISRLERDLENAGYDEDEISLPPSLILRAVEALPCAYATMKMLSTPQIQRVIDNRRGAKIQVMQAVKWWLMSQYQSIL